MTLDQTIDAVIELTWEEREILLNILRNQQIEARRHEIANDAQISLAQFRAGSLKPATAEQVIAELNEALEGDG